MPNVVIIVDTDGGREDDIIAVPVTATYTSTCFRL